MGRTERALITIGLVVFGASLVAQQDVPEPAARPADLPEWAFGPERVPGAPPRPSALPAEDDAVVRIPGSDRTFTRLQLRGRPEIPDWHPEDHGPMPALVKNGREGIRACGFCHLADGTGRPENATVNALPVAYFLQQMEDFKNGLRDSADPGKRNSDMMIGFAKTATAEEVRAVAEYFAAQPYPKRINVIESRTAPKVRLQGGMHMAIVGEGAGMEPIGDRIVEVPDDALRAEARDTRMGYTAYVPVGSIDKGRTVAANLQCVTCHGPNLGGLGPVPPLAGRSPSYTMRELYDMKAGTRHGLWSPLMKPVVDHMSLEDMMNVSAYTASLDPPAGGAR